MNKVILGDVCEKIGSGATPRGGSDIYLSQGEIALIRSKNVYNNGFRKDGLAYITDAHAKELESVALEPNDILLNITGDSVARCCQVPNDILPARVNQHVAIIRPRKDKLDSRYLRYYLIDPTTQNYMLMLAGGGATRNALTKGMIESFEVPTHLLPEQRAIAGILGTLDDKIELNRRMNRTLESMARAVFKSWFVDFTPVREKAEGVQPKGMDAETANLFPSKFVHSELGEIPLGWSVHEIKQLTSNIQYGFTQSASTEKVGPHFLRITDIQGGQVNWHDVPYCVVSSEDHEKYKLLPGDIVVARTGASTGENFYIVDAPDAVFASYLVRFQFEYRAIGRLVGIFMRTNDYFSYVANNLGGSAQPNANAQVLSGAVLTVPPLEVAKKYLEFVEPLDKMIYANNEESRTLASLRDSLLPKLMRGEVRVKDV